jgi:hypothetical protein
MIYPQVQAIFALSIAAMPMGIFIVEYVTT